MIFIFMKQKQQQQQQFQIHFIKYYKSSFNSQNDIQKSIYIDSIRVYVAFYLRVKKKLLQILLFLL